MLNEQKELRKKIRLLAKSLCQVEDENQMRAFLQDLCTPNELESMADRWNIVVLLNEGESYRSIAQKLATSTATVTRVARSLKYGEGYRQVLGLLSSKERQWNG